MFVCTDCIDELKLIKNLTDFGENAWYTSASVGPCACCENIAVCGEVFCEIDAYWED